MILILSWQRNMLICIVTHESHSSTNYFAADETVSMLNWQFMWNTFSHFLNISHTSWGSHNFNGLITICFNQFQHWVNRGVIQKKSNQIRLSWTSQTIRDMDCFEKIHVHGFHQSSTWLLLLSCTLFKRTLSHMYSIRRHFSQLRKNIN